MEHESRNTRRDDPERAEKRPEPKEKRPPRPRGWARDAELRRSVNAAVQDSDVDER